MGRASNPNPAGPYLQYLRELRAGNENSLPGGQVLVMLDEGLARSVAELALQADIPPYLAKETVDALQRLGMVNIDLGAGGTEMVKLTDSGRQAAHAESV